MNHLIATSVAQLARAGPLGFQYLAPMMQFSTINVGVTVCPLERLPCGLLGVAVSTLLHSSSACGAAKVWRVSTAA